jgi:hypothetical protein
VRRVGVWLLAAWPLLLGPAACTCKGKPQEARSMGPAPQESPEKRKEADFPAEMTEKPKDFEKGEGVPKGIKDVVDKAFDKTKKPKKA